MGVSDDVLGKKVRPMVTVEGDRVTEGLWLAHRYDTYIRTYGHQHNKINNFCRQLLCPKYITVNPNQEHRKDKLIKYFTS